MSNQTLDHPQEVREPTGRILRKNHLESHIIGDPLTKVQIKAYLRSQHHITLISEIELIHILDAVEDEHWVKEMQEELDHFQKNGVYKLLELPK